ncbi:hypothetical protein [Alicyclobacillus fructus]|uniref:hypothetical protein n=1 Tax=Alicyclobacillus fructus TaxID=2816082 RepID=UPI001F1AAEF3|nr:hypothetical protein [Alicyclobacillus fructus]
MPRPEDERARSGRPSYMRLGDAPAAFRAWMSLAVGMTAAWMVTSVFWSRAGGIGDLALLTLCTWAAGAVVAWSARRTPAVALILGAAAGAACSVAVFGPLHRPAWLAAGLAGSALVAAMSAPFLTYGDIALASQVHVRVATAAVLLATVAYLAFVRPLSSPNSLGQAAATMYPCAIIVLAATTARAAHRLTYGSRARRAWLAALGLAVAFRDLPVEVMQAIARYALYTAGLIAVATPVIAFLPRFLHPGAFRNKGHTPNHPPGGVRMSEHAAPPHAGLPVVLISAVAAVAILVALALMTRRLVASPAASTEPHIRPAIVQRRLEDEFRLAPTTHPVRVRMQQRLRAWHRAGHTLARGETVRSFTDALPGALLHPDDPALVRAYERVRYGPDEP